MLNIKLMSKILLVYDDFAELTALDSSLKKVGFDVVGLTNEFTIKDQIISFNPEILICFGNSSRVSSLSVGKKLKEMTRWQGKTILIFPAEYDIPPDEIVKIRMDMMLEAPVPLTRIIQIISKLSGLDEQSVIDKLVNSFVSEKSELVNVSNIQKAKEKPNPVTKMSEPSIKIESPKTTEERQPESNSSGPEGAIKKRYSDPFQELMQELSGEPFEKNTLEAKERAAEPSNSVELTDEEREKIKKQVEEHNLKLGDRLKQYAQITVTTSLYPQSMIKKVKVKKLFKEIKKNWDKEDLARQDNYRIEFVKALFKKK